MECQGELCSSRGSWGVQVLKYLMMGWGRVPLAELSSVPGSCWIYCGSWGLNGIACLAHVHTKQ